MWHRYFGVAGWASQGRGIRLAPRAGLCTYNVGTAVVLAILGTYGGMKGILLWPAVGLHGLIGATVLWVMQVIAREGKPERDHLLAVAAGCYADQIRDLSRGTGVISVGSGEDRE